MKIRRKVNKNSNNLTFSEADFWINFSNFE